MAHYDVFVSYASRDAALAEELVRHLEAAGKRVFWDRGSISAGEEFERAIQNALADADCVVALVTDNYVGSRLSRYEMRAAIEAQKLIPVLFASQAPEELHELPVIFTSQDTDWKDQLVSWLAAKKPQGSPAKMRRARTPPPPLIGESPAPISAPVDGGPQVLEVTYRARKAPPLASPVGRRRFGALALQEIRIQTFAWLSIGGAVVTLAGNLDAFLVFADWLDWVSRHWGEMLAWLWNFLIPFDIHVLPEDAVIFTLLAVLFVNVLLTSSDKDRNVAAGVAAWALLLCGVLATFYLGFAGFLYELDAAAIGVTDRVMAPALGWLHAFAPPHFDHAAAFAGMTAIGACVLGVAYAPTALVFAIKPNVRGFGARLWRILVGVGVVALANQVSLSIETYEWGGV